MNLTKNCIGEERGINVSERVELEVTEPSVCIAS